MSRVAGAVALIVIVALAAAPAWAARSDMRLLGEIFTYLALASLWNLLAGSAGLVSVGQQAFVGFGGYMLFAFTIFAGLHPLLAIVVAGVLGAAAAVPVAVLIFRLSGAYFAIGTWVIAEVFRLLFAQISSLGGGSGSSLPAAIVRGIAEGRDLREWVTYWAALALAVLSSRSPMASSAPAAAWRSPPSATARSPPRASASASGEPSSSSMSPSAAPPP